MNLKDINNKYEEILNMDNGTEPVKFDLHIHTPGSSDFCIPNGYDLNSVYIKILDEVLESGLKIIAITDHNTFNGFNEIIKIQQKEEKYKNILILCGIEITCFSKHILAIFDSNFTKEKQKEFLKEIGIDCDEEGIEEGFADELTPTNLMKKIYDYGGITILAHIDANHGFIYEKIKKDGDSEITFSGNSLSKIFKSNYLYGLQISRDTNLNKIDNLLNNYSFKRKDRKLGYLFFSDSHGIVVNGKYSATSGNKIGEKYTTAKMSSICFSALKLVLLESDLRIINNILVDNNYPIIQGISIKSSVFNNSNNFTNFRFNDEMNCIIGSRGTGKSTILEVIKKTMLIDSKRSNNSTINDSDILNRFEECIVYLSYDKNIYAFYYKPITYITEYDEKKIDNRRTIRKIYVMRSNKFVLLEKENYHLLRNIMISSYDQRQLYEYTRDPNKLINIIDDFLMWEDSEKVTKLNSQISHQLAENEELLNKIESERLDRKLSFIDYIVDNSYIKVITKKNDLINSLNNNLSNLRKDKIKYVNNLLKGKIKLGFEKDFSNEIKEYLSTNFPKEIRVAESKDYQFEVDLKKILNNVMVFSSYKPKFDFFANLIEEKYENIIKDYNLSQFDNIEEMLKYIRKNINIECMLSYLQDNIILEYNVNAYNDSEDIYRKNTQLSLGQNAVAVLSLVLSVADDSKDARPLILDQPEDDLDNSYIFSNLVPEFRKAKKNRQLIISTHNPNIPVSGDAENIIVLKYNGVNSFVDQNGSIDNISISNSVVEILEGGKEALEKRNMKYIKN